MKPLRLIILLLSALPLLAACKDSSDAGEEPVREDEVYLKLTINMPSSETRANPTAGDDGDGREDGIEPRENKINDLTVFFYEEEADGVGPNSKGDTPVKGYYILANTDNEYLFKLKNLAINPDKHRILVAANMGNLTGLTTLQAVRDYIVGKAWTDGTSGLPHECENFTMATAYNKYNNQKDGAITDGDGTFAKPYRASTWIERTAARIDFWFKEENIADGTSYLKYQVKEKGAAETGDPLATVYLENIVPTNLMQQGTWMFKRATAGITDDYSCFNTFTYCGRETASTGGVPTNYVLEPHTTQKTADTDITAWYGDTRAENIRTNYTTIFEEEKYKLYNYLPHQFERTESGYDFTKCVTLAYTNENTQHMSMHNSKFLTGLVLKATYVPAKVYSDAEATTLATSYSRGQTFWRYTPTRQEMKESDALYFTNEEAAKAYAAKTPGTPYEIQEFPYGVCYYNIWLRHANIERDPHQEIPMEFGTVRNNIYRVGVEFRGPGTPTPEVKEPFNIRFRIFVREWRVRTHSQILM